MLVAVGGCGSSTPLDVRTTGVQVLRPVTIAEIEHDRGAFTEGLQRYGDVLYESTGLEGRSQLRMLDLGTGAVRRSVPLPGAMFGEGIAVVGDTIWQLTWRDGVALQWDRNTMTLVGQVPISGEGWGLCSDGTRLVRSDGSDRLTFHDPATFAVLGTVSVTADGRPVTQLNELECVDGEVWANVWHSDQILRIDPRNGTVGAVVDATGLLEPDKRAGVDVLNGITALDGNEFLLTGKLWPSLYRVRFVPVDYRR